jgi:2',3'-cyclic-nucleotide 2'-phosphodiesterase (5'-nucleotidase family)
MAVEGAGHRRDADRPLAPDLPGREQHGRQFNLPGVDKVKGTVNGVPTVMANYWGKHLGVINLG